MHRLRLDMGVADKERGRLEARLAAKEREIGGLTNKVRGRVGRCRPVLALVVRCRCGGQPRAGR